ncbi:MAG: hypothetical protein JXR58_10340 [Bacteroidales bacterium]|nr:hypothetical protein [Bacteroidales bacterium]
MTISRVSPVKRLIILISAVLAITGGFFLSFYKTGTESGIELDSGIHTILNLFENTKALDKLPLEFVVLLLWPVIMGFLGLILLLQSFVYKKWTRILGFLAAYGAISFSLMVFFRFDSALAAQNIDIFIFFDIGFYMAAVAQLLAVVGVTMRA